MKREVIITPDRPPDARARRPVDDYVTASEIVEEKERTDREIAKVRGQLEAARAELRASGAYADPKWYARATGYARLMGQRSQALQRRLAELKKAEADQGRRKADEKPTFERRFIQAFKRLVRERVGAEEYKKIIDEAVDEARVTAALDAEG